MCCFLCVCPKWPIAGDVAWMKKKEETNRCVEYGNVSNRKANKISERQTGWDLAIQWCASATIVNLNEPEQKNSHRIRLALHIMYMAWIDFNFQHRKTTWSFMFNSRNILTLLAYLWCARFLIALFWPFSYLTFIERLETYLQKRKREKRQNK